MGNFLSFFSYVSLTLKCMKQLVSRMFLLGLNKKICSTCGGGLVVKTDLYHSHMPPEQ